MNLLALTLLAVTVKRARSKGKGPCKPRAGMTRKAELNPQPIPSGTIQYLQHLHTPLYVLKCIISVQKEKKMPPLENVHMRLK